MSEYIVRATAADAQIRAFAVSAREMVEEMRQLHDTSPVMTAALGRLLVGGAMMGSMLKGEKDLLTLQVRGDGPAGALTVTANAACEVKGYAVEPQVILPANAQGKLDVAGAVGSGFLRVVKDMGMKEPYVGETQLQTGEIAEDLTYYFATSEQVPSCVGLGVLMEQDNTVRQAGGFIIQLMPFAEDEVIETLERNLAEFSSVTAVLDEGKSAEEMLGVVLKDLDLQVTDRVKTGYHCGCSKERVRKAILSIGKKELDEMIADGEEIEVGCHFCNRNYLFSVEELQEMTADGRESETT